METAIGGSVSALAHGGNMFERKPILLEFRRLALVPSLVAILAIGGCGGGDPEPAPTASDPAAASTAAATDGSAANPDGSDPTADPAAAEPEVQLTVSELLSAASTSVAENRLIAPAGNNAFYFYLQVLDQEPRNSAAQVAILELMPLAQGMAEQLIEQRNYEDADQAVALLKLAQPSSVVLATLEQRVISYKRADDQRAQSEERARLAEEARVAAQANAPAPAPTPAPAPPPPAAPAPTPAPAPPTQVASTEPVAPAAPPPSQENSNFELITRVNPSYPSRALRQQVSGWVELEFTITVAGDVRDVSVVNAEPRRIFDRAATRALEAWKFKPKIENGQAVATTARQRLEFSLGN